VNPDVDPRRIRTSRRAEGEQVRRRVRRRAGALPATPRTLPGIAVHGIDIHIGSQITELEPYREATRKILDLVDALAAAGIALAHVDVGGGLGIATRDESPVPLAGLRGDADAAVPRPPRADGVRARAGAWSATPASCSPAVPLPQGRARRSASRSSTRR
jgi:hypothetical protein